MKAIVAACALAIPALASADEVGHWYVNPNFGGVSVDNDRPVQDKDWLYGIGIGKHVNRGLSIELNQTGAQVGGGPGRSDLSLWGTSLDFLGVMNRGGWVSPYVSVGAGVLSDEPSPGRNSTDFMTQAGLGMFINAGARSVLLEGERQKFLNEDWPRIYATIQRLGLKAEDLLSGASRPPSPDTARSKAAEAKAAERKR